MIADSPSSISIVGFSEAGQAFAAGLAQAGAEVRVYDLRFNRLEDNGRLLDVAERLGVAATKDIGDCVRNADYVLSTVTAAAATHVARDAAPSLKSGSVFLDLNSISPEAKRAGAAFVDAGSGYYVEGAIMAPVRHQGHATPILAGGARAVQTARVLGDFGMCVTAVGAAIGPASAVKMCRSIVMKGIEALVLEALVAASAYDVIDQVVASLAQSYPEIDWPERSAYLIGRVLNHGHRRAEEMREAAIAVREAGLEPIMAEAIAARQAWAADLDLPAMPESADYRELAAHIGRAASCDRAVRD